MSAPMPDGRATTPWVPESAIGAVGNVPSSTIRMRITDRSSCTVTLAVAGDIDLATTDRLSQTLLSTIDSQTCQDLHLDLHDVRFLGAAGVGALAEACHRAAQRGVTVRLVRVSRVARRALEITGVTGCFEHWPSRTETEPTWTG